MSRCLPRSPFGKLMPEHSGEDKQISNRDTSSSYEHTADTHRDDLRNDKAEEVYFHVKRLLDLDSLDEITNVRVVPRHTFLPILARLADRDADLAGDGVAVVVL